MLATQSTELKGNETFTEAYMLIPEKTQAKIRKLFSKSEDSDNYDDCQYYQLSLDNGQTWESPRKNTTLPKNLDSKSKLANTEILYDIFTKPTLVGSDTKNSWLVGDIDNCNILGDNYNVQGLIISSIFDPLPKYFISFERVVCQNQFSTLGKNNCSMYIDMNKFLNYQTAENKEKLTTMIQLEAEHRIEDANRIYDKLATTHLTENQIRRMFEMLTIDKVAKTNKEKYQAAEIEYSNYMNVYNLNDNQNYKNSLFGFVNACTNIRTRQKTNPLDVIKPVLPADVIDSPCNFDYLCRAAILNNAA